MRLNQRLTYTGPIMLEKNPFFATIAMSSSAFVCTPYMLVDLSGGQSGPPRAFLVEVGGNDDHRFFRATRRGGGRGCWPVGISAFVGFFPLPSLLLKRANRIRNRLAIFVCHCGFIPLWPSTHNPLWAVYWSPVGMSLDLARRSQGVSPASNRSLAVLSLIGFRNIFWSCLR